jgi:hypothetical protein
VFGVNAYADNDNILIALVEGKISLGLNGKEVFLKPGEISLYNEVNNELNIKKSDNVEKYTGWCQGRFVFCNTLLSEFTKVLLYNFKVSITVENLRNTKYKTMQFLQIRLLRGVLNMLIFTAPVRYLYEKSKLTGEVHIQMQK